MSETHYDFFTRVKIMQKGDDVTKKKILEEAEKYQKSTGKLFQKLYRYASWGFSKRMPFNGTPAPPPGAVVFFFLHIVDIPEVIPPPPELPFNGRPGGTRSFRFFFCILLINHRIENGNHSKTMWK